MSYTGLTSPRMTRIPIQDQGCWKQDQDPWEQDQGRREQDHGPWEQDQGPWEQDQSRVMTKIKVTRRSRLKSRSITCLIIIIYEIQYIYFYSSSDPNALPLSQPTIF